MFAASVTLCVSGMAVWSVGWGWAPGGWGWGVIVVRVCECIVCECVSFPRLCRLSV